MAAATRWLLKRLGSPSATWGRVVGIGLLLAVINLILLGVQSLVAVDSQASALAVSLIVVVLNLVVAAGVCRRAFRLTRRAAWGVVGVQIAVSIAIVLIQVLIIRPFVVEAFVLPTGSMRPTLVEKDLFFSNKRLTPRRWDIVTFLHDGSPPVKYCKRLIGLPGERVRFEGATVFINDQPAPAPAVFASQQWLGDRRAIRYRDGETITLGSDECFLIGDHLDASSDSRYEGPVKIRAITGVVDCRYWPLASFKVFR